MIRIVVHSLSCVLLACAAWACTDSHMRAGGGSESHFLSCTEDVDCAGGMTCSAGVCVAAPAAEAPPASAPPAAGGPAPAPQDVGGTSPLPIDDPGSLGPDVEMPAQCASTPAARMTPLREAPRLYMIALPLPAHEATREIEIAMDLVPFPHGYMNLEYEAPDGTRVLAAQFRNGLVFSGLPYDPAGSNRVVFRIDVEAGTQTIRIGDNERTELFYAASPASFSRLILAAFPYDEEDDLADVHVWRAALGPTFTIAYDGGAPIDLLAPTFCGRAQYEVPAGLVRSTCVPAAEGDLQTCPADCTVELETDTGLTNVLDWLFPPSVDLPARGTSRLALQIVPVPDMPTSLVLERLPGEAVLSLDLAGGSLAGLPYEPAAWNDVGVVFDFDHGSYEVSVNGATAAPLALPPLSADATLSLGLRTAEMPAEAADGNAWVKNVRVERGTDGVVTELPYDQQGTQLYPFAGDVVIDCPPPFAE